jgi:ABC-type transport system involved in multi-copper enzyme maturation permease subunit
MGSNGSISTFGTRMMPFLAIVQHDLRMLVASWLVRLWLAASALLTLVLTLAHWKDASTAVLIASLLFPYLVFPWFLVVMVLGVGPVSAGRAESLADGILSRPVTRYEYLLATWSSRVVLVLGVYLIVIVPAIAALVLAHPQAGTRPPPDDPVTLYGILGALGATALVMTLQVSLGLLLGTLLRRPLLAVVVLIFVWYPIDLVLNTFSLEEFSPISLSQALPTLLRQPWREAETNRQQTATDKELAAWAGQAAHFLKVLSGPPEEPVQQKPGFFDRGQYGDFSLWRVVLGYGIPTLAAVALATLCFCVRDL